MTYYILLHREPGQRFGVAFGDYDKATVEAELEDCRASTGQPKSDFRIMISPTDEQEAIDQGVDRMNYDYAKAEAERRYGDEGVYAFEALAMLPHEFAKLSDHEYAMRLQGAMADMGAA